MSLILVEATLKQILYYHMSCGKYVYLQQRVQFSIVMAIARAKVSLCWSSLFVLVLLEELGSSDQSLLYQILDNKTRENSSFANDSSLHQLHDYLARELCDPPMEGKLSLTNLNC